MENQRNEQHPRNEKPEQPTYTVTVYVAAPGTPIRKENGETQPSRSGHVYYSISDGKSTSGYGFASVHGEYDGPGRIVRNEYENYQKPLYRRTLEITQDQYRKLQDYGDTGVLGKEAHFDLHYNAGHNSCVDFVWKGLNHAGIHKRHAMAFDNQNPYPDKGYEGSLKPTRNIDDLEHILPPIPDSPHNRIERNPMPERTLLHKLLSEESAAPDAALAASRPDSSPDNPSHPDHAMLEQIREHVRNLDRTHGREFDQRSEQLSHSLLTLAKDNGLSRVDHVVLSRPSATLKPGENVFVVQGDPRDPMMLRADMKTEVAMQTPVAESERQLEVVNQRLAQEQMQSQQREQQVARDSPAMRM